VGAFGEKLRKQREQRGIALDAISNTTKISTRMLRALEDEHFDQLPGGVFNKGFVRAYARQVGLDEEEAIADYLAALRESQVQAHSILPDFRDPQNRSLQNRDPHNRDLRNNDLQNNDLRKNNLPGNNGSAERGRQLLRDERRKQGRRNEDRHNEDRRDNDRRDKDHRDKDRGSDSRRDERRRHKDLSPLPDSATRVPAAYRPAERFRQKYPAGGPEQPAAPDNALSTEIPWGKLAVGLLVVTFALALWNSRRHRESTAVPRPAVASSQSPAPAPVTAPASLPTKPSSSPASLAVAKASPGAMLSSGKFSPVTVPSASTPSPTTSTAITLPRAVSPPSSKSAPKAASQTESALESTTEPAANLPSANPVVAKRTAPAAAAKPSTFTLLIRAEETSWVSIMADGKPVAEETLIAPAHTSVRASGEVVVKTGNAAGLSFQLNGKEIPTQGNEGEVKTYVFDSTGVRVLPQP
jgi:cytoskeletal protein RodZ